MTDRNEQYRLRAGAEHFRRRRLNYTWFLAGFLFAQIILHLTMSIALGRFV